MDPRLKKSWLGLALIGTGLLAAQVVGWRYLVHADLERAEMRMREGLRRTTRELSDDADCVQLYSRLTTHRDRPFFLITPTEGGATDTLRHYSQRSDLKDTIAHPPVFAVDRHAYVDVIVRWRFTERTTHTAMDGQGEPLRYSTDGPSLCAIDGHERLSLFDTLKLERLLRTSMLNEPFKGLEYAVVDTVTDQVVLTNTSRTARALAATGFHESLYGVDEGVAPLAVLVDIPDRWSAVAQRRLAWLVVPMLFTCALLVILVFRDRTVQARQKLAQMQLDLVSNITHELNTPIANIALALNTLKKSPSSGSRISNDQLWDIIQVENKRLHATIKKVLDVSMLEGEQLMLVPEMHDMNVLIATVAEEFRLAALERNITIHLCLNAQEPWVRVDVNYIANVLHALIDNAIKYGGDHANVSLWTSDDEAGVMVDVKDDGPGIPRNERELVFQKFYRVRNGDRYAVQGTGIGLYYARQVVEAHGGWIVLARQQSVGCCFQLFIPSGSHAHGQVAHR